MRIVALLIVTACTRPSPAPISGGNGESWSFPLVRPLENGPILVPVMIGQNGPYVFVVDPDAERLAVDAQVVSEAKLHPHDAKRRAFDELTNLHRLIHATVPLVKLGDLEV